MSNPLTSRPSLRLWPGVALAIALTIATYVVPFVAADVEIADLPLALLGILTGAACALGILVWWTLFSRARWLERLAALALMALGVYATSLLIDESIRGAHMGVMLYLQGIPILTLALVAWAVATNRLADGARRAWLVVAIVIALAPWTLIRTAGVIGPGSEIHWRWAETPEERLLTQADAALPAAPLAVPSSVERATPPGASPSAPQPAEAGKAATPGSPSTTTPPADSASPSGRPIAPGETPDARGRDLSPVGGSPALSGDPGRNRAAGPATSERGDPGAPAATRGNPERSRGVEWPGFRGPERDGVVHGVRIATDWSASPPVQVWRRPIGPGWSSFSVRGDYLYTQEQRGEHEIVACYRVSTGQPVWSHRDAARFWESNGGAGPRGTPTIDGNRVYAFGATGILNALDADTGALAWSRNVASDTGRAVPDWGFASSPLIVDGVVIVAAAGTLAGYDVATGEPRWRGPSHGGSYSSPHRATLDGVDQILLLGGPGAISVAPDTGAVLWKHAWNPGPIVQPALTEDGDLLINAIISMGGIGIRRLTVTHDEGGWSLVERWTSNGLKPYFNDFVVHKGQAYGFDGSILASINLADGKRNWKGGRYGNGQMLLLSDQDVLLVLSEDGELALVSATTDKYTEMARIPALDGKTWNHPVLVGNILLVRNGQEMAAFRLAMGSW
jgi:outer membrane protein assembly factor BamB